MEIKYRDIVLRDMRESDIADEIRWYTEETRWASWDAPWESLEEVKNFNPEKCRQEQQAFLAREKPAIRNVLELDTVAGQHLGTVSSYLIDENYDWIARSNVKDGQTVHRTIGIDICESGQWGRGLGKQALSAWLLYFLGNGVTELYLQTWSGNLRMIRTALRLGFRECHRQIAERLVDGRNYDGLTFRLSVPEFRRYLLVESLRDLDFSPEDAREVLEAYDSRPQFFEQAAQSAYAGEVPDFPICKRSPLERLVIWCCHLTAVQQKYQSFGIPHAVVLETIQDIALRRDLYREKTGKIGLSRDDVIWFRHLENACIFRLGSLQFQRFHMLYLDKEGCGEDYMTFTEEQKLRLPPGAPVINVHIPKGADLSPDAVADAFRRAGAFFPQYFPEHSARAYLCYSWLLYPGLQALLPSSSNILRFASRFQIIGTAPDASEAIRRIYGKRYSKSSDYPQETTLQRAALNHFSSLGDACGIIEIP